MRVPLQESNQRRVGYNGGPSIVRGVDLTAYCIGFTCKFLTHRDKKIINVGERGRMQAEFNHSFSQKALGDIFHSGTL